MHSMFKEKNKQDKKYLKTNYKRTILIVISFSLITILGAAYFFFGRDFGGVTLNIEANGPVRIGEPFEVLVTLENNTDKEISEVNMSLSLPQGVMFADKRGDIRRISETRTIPARAFGRETFIVVITEFSDNKVFKAEAEYLPALLGRKMKTSKDIQVEVQKWLSLNIEAPNKIVSGEEFEWTFSYKNDSDKDLMVDLDIELPEELIGDIPNKRFRIASREHKSETLTASIIMEEGSRFEIKAIARGNIEDREYILGEAEAEITIAPSPLFLNISSTKREGDPLSPGEEVGYVISFRNNSDKIMRDIIIKAELEGEMFDVPLRILNWTATEIPELAEISPGQSSSVNFSAKIAGEYPIKKINDRDFMVRINARIESPTVPRALKSSKTVNIDSMQQKIAGKIDVSARAFYRDAASRIINKGVFPPIIGQPTEYSIHWMATSYSTDMSEVEISAEIPPGVEFVRQVRADAGEFVFNTERNIVTWRIPKLLATTGILSQPMSVVFQIRATPTQEHLGLYMPILGPINMTAIDNFTGSSFSSFQELITTELPEDKTIRPGEGMVKQSL